MRCGESDDRCEVLRTCPQCKRMLSTTGHRIMHQNSCPSETDMAFAQQQHDHAVTQHRYRRKVLN